MESELKFLCRWELVMCLDAAKWGKIIHRDKELKLQRLIFTPRNKRSGEYGREVHTFFLDGDETEYTVAQIKEKLLADPVTRAILEECNSRVVNI